MMTTPATANFSREYWIRHFEARVYALGLDIRCLSVLPKQEAGMRFLRGKIDEAQGIIAALEEGTWVDPSGAIAL